MIYILEGIPYCFRPDIGTDFSESFVTELIHTKAENCLFGQYIRLRLHAAGQIFERLKICTVQSVYIAQSLLHENQFSFTRDRLF